MIKLKESVLLSGGRNSLPIVSVDKGRQALRVGLGFLGKNRKCLVLFVKHRKQIEVIDRLFFDESRNEWTSHPFSWQHYRDGNSQSRAHVKKRLRSLGLNPNLVDENYPEFKEQLTSITEIAESPLFVGITGPVGANRRQLIVFSKSQKDVSIIDGFEPGGYADDPNAVLCTVRTRIKLNRKEAKQYLTKLGFNSELIDKVFPLARTSTLGE